MNKSMAKRMSCWLVLLALPCAERPAGAEQRFWTNPGGGGFSDSGNWDDGLQPPPGVGDTAIFDLDAAYTVSFIVDALTDRAIIRRGAVDFFFPLSEFAGYRLVQPSFTEPALVIGDTPSGEAHLTITNGDVEAEFVHIADTPGSIAALTLLGEVEFTVMEMLRVGVSGDATLAAFESSSVECQDAEFAVAPGSFAEVIVAGPGAQWDVEDLFIVGKQGEAEVTFAGGADLATGDAIIAQQDGASASLHIEGFGSNWFCIGSLDVGLFEAGSMTVSQGAWVACEQFISLGTLVTDKEATSILRVTDEDSRVMTSGDLHVGLVGNARLEVGRGAHVVVDGDLVESFDGSAALSITLSDHDQYLDPAIQVGGITGPFNVEVHITGFDPEPGDRFEIIEAFGGLGPLTFDLPSLAPPLAWQVQQQDTLVALLVTEGSIPGDVDGDMLVNFTDLLLVLSDWGPCPGCPADLDGDTVVGFTDLLIVLDNWTR